MPFSPDQIIGEKYQLKQHLARGGMGAVWRAHHLDLGMDVAIKVLRSDVVGDETAAARFRREARAAAQLKSAHVVQVHDFGVHGDVPYLVMELLEGEDLDEYLEREGPLSVEHAVALIEEACEGLALVHEKGIVHRDIKPSNLFLARQGSRALVKLLDFGIAKASISEDGETTQGLVLGSPAYMSPEHARGGVIDARSDLWSLAGVFYRMITGVVPFDGANSSDIVVKLCTEDVAPPSDHLSESDPPLDAFFRRALCRDPAQRPESARAFAAAARALVDPKARSNALTGTEAQRRSFSSNGICPSGRSDETAPLSTAAPLKDVPPVSAPLAGSEHPTNVGGDGSARSPRLVPRVLLVALIVGGLLVAGVMWRAAHRGEERPMPHDVPPSAVDAPGPASPREVGQVGQGVDAEPTVEPTDDRKTPPSQEELDPVEAPGKRTVSGPSSSPKTSPASAPALGPRRNPAPRPTPNPARDPVFGLPVEAP